MTQNLWSRYLEFDLNILQFLDRKYSIFENLIQKAYVFKRKLTHKVCFSLFPTLSNYHNFPKPEKTIDQH